MMSPREDPALRSSAAHRPEPNHSRRPVDEEDPDRVGGHELVDGRQDRFQHVVQLHVGRDLRADVDEVGQLVRPSSLLPDEARGVRRKRNRDPR